MGAWLSVTMLLAAVGPPVAVRPVTPQPPNGLRKAGAASVVPAANFTVNVTPATITFSATNPSSAPVDSGSSTASVSWTNLDFAQGAWSLTVQAGSPSFINCPTVPVSAVTVSCASVSTSIGGSGTCSPPFTLSTSAQTVAGGNQGFITYSYAVTLNFTLADNWKYIAETSPSCSLSLSYIATVP
jgi:hypothetical protein